MAMSRRGPEQGGMWVATQDLPRSPGHAFYDKLNEVLGESGFDRFVEEICEAHYADGLGRPSIAPGVYFRMLFIGYFEGLDSQRAIAWRCADSLSLRTFLGMGLTASTPEHSSMTRIRKRLPEDVFWQVFAFVLQAAAQLGILKGKTIAVDSTTLEANAAMKSLVRRATNEDWKTYVRRLMSEEGIEDPNDEEVRRFDSRRKKTTSNKDWKSSTDPDSRVTKMKDGRTHLAYKAEHAVDLDSGLIVGSVVYRADQADSQTLTTTMGIARLQLEAAGSPRTVEEVVGDKGYHKTETIQELEEVHQVRTYLAEPKQNHRRRWKGKKAGLQQALYANRRRIRGKRGRSLGRLRSEKAERSFAHVCETGGGRRTWLRGRVNVSKAHLMRAAACDLGIVMLALFGIGTPRTLQGGFAMVLGALLYLICGRYSRLRQSLEPNAGYRISTMLMAARSTLRPEPAFSTGC